MHPVGLEKIILKKAHSACTKKLKSQSTCLNLVGVRGGASSWFDSRGEIPSCCGVSLSLVMKTLIPKTLKKRGPNKSQVRKLLQKSSMGEALGGWGIAHLIQIWDSAEPLPWFPLAVIYGSLGCARRWDPLKKQGEGIIIARGKKSIWKSNTPVGEKKNKGVDLSGESMGHVLTYRDLLFPHPSLDSKWPQRGGADATNQKWIEHVPGE